jgi:hypothetical protein
LLVPQGLGQKVAISVEAAEQARTPPLAMAPQRYRSSFRISPARYRLPQINTLAAPRFLGMPRKASATSGPGRATPPDAATIASTGKAAC